MAKNFLEQITDCDLYNSRARSILNYWLDIELFELPECDTFKKDEIKTYAADHFLDKGIKELMAEILVNPDFLKESSRLTIMFQCHRAGYVLNQQKSKNYASNPNVDIPRTFLVSHNFVPKWDKDKQTLHWTMSQEEQDLVVNYATIRTIFRNCPPKTAHNLRLSQYLANSIEQITALFKTTFGDDNGVFELTSEELRKKVIGINRSLAKQFWVEEHSRDFMYKHCASLEISYADLNLSEEDKKDDEAGSTQDGTMTFRWRYRFFQELPSEQEQLGPFFVQDLEHCIGVVNEQGIKGLSFPLQNYLFGNTNQMPLPPALNNGETYIPLTNRIPKGRWATDSRFGLSLMQSVAVNVALSDDPVIAVNGPPGTGKTTLLKDIIATKVVERTILLNGITKDDDWFENLDNHKKLLKYSMIVASSNNRAVENISKELPAKNSIDKAFSLTHFSHLAKEGDWGLFCAVLGNSGNRRNFKEILSKLQSHLKYRDDVFGLNLLVLTLKNAKDNTNKIKALSGAVKSWYDRGQIYAILTDFEQCSNYHKGEYQGFFKNFSVILEQVSNNQLNMQDFTKRLEYFDDVHWEMAFSALEAVKKQWYGKKLYEQHHKTKLDNAKARFRNAYWALYEKKEGKIILKNLFEQGDTVKYLLSSSAYLSSQNDLDKSIQEANLQLKSPFSNQKINQIRSELFCASMALNEALLEYSAKQMTDQNWADLTALIDGNLQSQETTPYHAKLWSMLFLFFPVLSTSLSSVENQFRQMQTAGGFGLGIIDEAGQAVNYHIVGLLQRCRQMILVGDPIQLEPVVNIPAPIDQTIAKEYLSLSEEYQTQNPAWGDNYVVTNSSAQLLADRAGRYMAKIGDRKVGIPLFVHRRCLEPMFSIANAIAYDNKMVFATHTPKEDLSIPKSAWINVAEATPDGFGYQNKTEAKATFELIKHLSENYPKMVAGGVFIISPFKQMSGTLIRQFKELEKNPNNHQWLQKALGVEHQHKPLKEFARDNIGTVHTFQGKEASVVIICMSASAIRNKMGGIKWVNSKPNLLNVAVTRAKQFLFVMGNVADWQKGMLSAQMLEADGLLCYQDLSDFMAQKPIEKSQIAINTKTADFDFWVNLNDDSN